MISCILRMLDTRSEAFNQKRAFFFGKKWKVPVFRSDEFVEFQIYSNFRRVCSQQRTAFWINMRQTGCCMLIFYKHISQA